MQDKTIAFIGDSLGRQQFQSLMCMATGGEDMPEVENVGWKYGLVKPRGAICPDGWAYRSCHKVCHELGSTSCFSEEISCDNTIPLTKGNEVQQEESSDPVIGDAVKGTKVKLLDITAISELRDEGHISHYSLKASEGINDCLHWCLPGIPDMWNELLVIHIPGKRNSYSQVKSETKQDANAMHYMGHNASSAENTEAATVLEALCP
ncbi:hypothetical protein KY290_025881 [Solanum tuberosum]|uniref:Trichome birefringence-like C-terminal domain-containing protein n=1 Tax=Solanum tuberosum TaxID=4113 RepID=A0ABQ7UUV3_SOLTU|nr:hypothetical protein KY289_024952 [Solanum tuberosum]KAH0755611.1 hypothetical protein KY290_025881 [Solanum tuberosum]